MISIAELREYSNNSSISDALMQIYIDHAEHVIIEHIGYDPTQQTYAKTLSGNGLDTLQLFAKPITAILSLTIDGITIDPSAVIIDGINIYYPFGFTEGKYNVAISITAGYPIIPNMIKSVALQIAALKVLETGGNVGLSGYSSPDGGNRSFISYTNYDKYLQQLNSYKLNLVY